MDPLIYILPAYIIARLYIPRASLLDAAYIAALAIWTAKTNILLTLLAIPYILAVFVLDRGKLAPYAGFASAVSYTGIYLIAAGQEAPHIAALGFVMAAAAPATLLPVLDDEGSLGGLFRYLLISAISTSMLISGLALRGTWGDVGNMLLFLAIATELGAVPMYMWVVDVYGRSSPAGLALLASLPKIAAAAALVYLKPAVPQAVSLAVGALSMLIGNLGALTSHDLRRVLAYSTVAHSGFALFAYVLSPGLALALVFADAVGKMALFRQLDGGGSRWEALLLVMNQIGIPPVLGFWPKLYLLLAATHVLGTAAGLFVLANIVMSVPYYIRVFHTLPGGVLGFLHAAVVILALGLVPFAWISWILSL
ncbi:proton-conducting transporter membrane subunit [Pyrobaculum ferrireducens]|uniref:NADH/Ubiquinone/plastoquinone (Complex I) n=1 Tax=Pyrobaculum ferrireducens TaxID=1104324 RepID=G7VAU9_9CREN|nr:proton-conducting transporter membrane subunit [Pyrobaculum ferrireducens]AET33527.1 NADH/Ubiquinone/plastoquinone (complex I) [Pyrobaculum ferrireducens]